MNAVFLVQPFGWGVHPAGDGGGVPSDAGIVPSAAPAVGVGPCAPRGVLGGSARLTGSRGPWPTRFGRVDVRGPPQPPSVTPAAMAATSLLRRRSRKASFSSQVNHQAP